MYALVAEWRALLDPGTEAGVAQVKLVWWRDEIRRLAAGAPVHPITRHMAALPFVQTDFSHLEAAVEAAAAEVAGVPVERARELDAHAAALLGTPLLVAAYAGAPRQRDAVRKCTDALAAGEYLARAISEHRREAQRGRIQFPVDELLAAGIDNDDLAAAVPPPRLAAYLDELRRRASGHFAAADAALSPADRPALRHLAVLASLGGRRLNLRRSASGADFRFADLYNAWRAARRAAAARQP